MAAVFLSLNDLEAVFLGANTPVKDIVIAARQQGVVAVVIGLAASSDVREASERLEELRRQLPSTIVVAVGGNDKLPSLPGIVRIETLDSFADWSRALAAATSSRSNTGSSDH